jgi:antitoxin (DNA-binding transcriptional repressor) of toxin-antitoxin stability system
MTEPEKVAIRQFRAKLATYVLESDSPIAITRHGDTVGYFIPVRHKRTEAERQALTAAVAQLEQMLQEQGLTEEDLVADFKRLRAGEHP